MNKLKVKDFQPVAVALSILVFVCIFNGQLEIAKSVAMTSILLVPISLIFEIGSDSNKKSEVK